ncbi:hypothetical protein BC939DRAFT_476329 [Gamsiella multidivaricata]|uniref:uncharacterized protein n=1 Tax=Gamsiella multidivaricata TaxID=101098 RepID=UPI002220600A|nr:uncharacterized protein BC939DRAFT_476329 [Gamsiella multidivaricata]KAI7825096.1 hypothetical protein BC939DRAFT_476329 [Gamsiella multidivaricata]
MTPLNIHHKGRKRKYRGPRDPLMTIRVYNWNADASERDLTTTPYPSATDDVNSESHSPRAIRTMQPQLPSKDPRKQEPSFVVVRRQLNQLQDPTKSAWVSVTVPETISAVFSPTPTSPPPTASLEIIYTTETTATASATTTPKAEGQNPLTSIAVQLILGGLAAVCLIAVVLRCLHVNHQHHTITAARRRNLTSAQAQAAVHASVLEGRGQTHLIPTNEMTLAARLNMYRARTDVRTPYYPYQQEPHGTAGGGPLESVNSFVAPSYEQDVSPPPFMMAAGKPPAYADAVRSSLAPPTRPSEQRIQPVDPPMRPSDPSQEQR